MAKKQLMKGNVALCHGAIAAGCDAFFGYPITPQNEVPEYMSHMMPANDHVFLQAESEVAAINMVYGAASAGKRVMTSSSSPGISLKQEGISYIAACELPCVIVNVQRGGPGLGNTLPAQSDYFQTVKGGGHGDYKLLTLAPWSVQDCYEMVVKAFDMADKYRNPVMVLMDAIVGQMIEPVELHGNFDITKYAKPWATNGAKDRDRNVVNSLLIDPVKMQDLNNKIQAKYEKAALNEVEYSEYKTSDAELVLVAYGSPARICRTVVDLARHEGLPVGLLRPITLMPFPTNVISSYAQKDKAFLTVEMSHGQMVEDVRLAVNGKTKVDFYGTSGGVVPTPTDILNTVRAHFGKPPVISHYKETKSTKGACD